MLRAERLDLVALARRYADGLERARGACMCPGGVHTDVVVAEELLRQLGNVLEGATCLDETERSS